MRDYVFKRDNFHCQSSSKTESDAIDTLVTQNNVSAIYGDNLRLLALIRDGGYENQVKILGTCRYTQVVDVDE